VEFSHLLLQVLKFIKVIYNNYCFTRSLSYKILDVKITIINVNVSI